MGWWNSLDNDNKLIFAIIIAGALLMVVVIFIILCIVCRRKRVEDKCKYQLFIFPAPSYSFTYIFSPPSQLFYHLQNFCVHHFRALICMKIFILSDRLQKNWKDAFLKIYMRAVLSVDIFSRRAHTSQKFLEFYMCDSRPSQYITNRFLFSMLLVNVCMRRTTRGVCSFCVRLLSLINKLISSLTPECQNTRLKVMPCDICYN